MASEKWGLIPRCALAVIGDRKWNARSNRYAKYRFTSEKEISMEIMSAGITINSVSNVILFLNSTAVRFTAYIYQTRSLQTASQSVDQSVRSVLLFRTYDSMLSVLRTGFVRTDVPPRIEAFLNVRRHT